MKLLDMPLRDFARSKIAALVEAEDLGEKVVFCGLLAKVPQAWEGRIVYRGDELAEIALLSPDVNRIAPGKVVKALPFGTEEPVAERTAGSSRLAELHRLKRHFGGAIQLSPATTRLIYGPADLAREEIDRLWARWGKEQRRKFLGLNALAKLTAPPDADDEGKLLLANWCADVVLYGGPP